MQALGLTVLVDARICSPSSSLTWGLSQLQVSREDCGSLPVCFLYSQGVGLNFDFLQEASPGSVRQVLLVGKMPEDKPVGLQVPTQAGEDGGGDISVQYSCIMAPSSAVQAVVFSSEPTDPHS